MGALLYVPEEWTRNPARCAAAGIPATVTLLRKMAVGPHPVAAHAGGQRDADRGRRRRRIRGQPHSSASPAPPAPPLCRGHLAEPHGVSRHPTLRSDRQQPRPRNRRERWPDQDPVGVSTLERRAAGTGVAARRMAQWHHSALLLRFRRAPGDAGHRLATAPARARGVAALRACARAGPAAANTTSSRCPPRRRSHRWCGWRTTAGPSNSTTRNLKTELGLDHFEGRSYQGWQHHLVISAVAYAFLQAERMRPRTGPRLTFPQVRAFVQAIFTGLLFISRPR